MTGLKASKANNNFIHEWERTKDHIVSMKVLDDISLEVCGKILCDLNVLYAKHNRVLKELDKPEAYWIKEKASKFTVVCSGCDYESIIWNARYCPNCGARMKEKHYEK